MPRPSPTPPEALDLQLARVQRTYAEGVQRPRDLLARVRAACESLGEHLFVSLARPEQIDEQLEAAMRRQIRGVAQPLFGVPFAVRDNIHCSGWTTTLGLPSLRLTPCTSAPVVARLAQLGAILVGKTRLEPFGISPLAASPLNADIAPPDAVAAHAQSSDAPSHATAQAVALGLVSFALATDSDGLLALGAAQHGVTALKLRRDPSLLVGIVSNRPSVESLCILTHGAGDALRLFDCTRPLASHCDSGGNQSSWPPVGADCTTDEAVTSARKTRLTLGIPSLEATPSPSDNAPLVAPYLAQQLDTCEAEIKAVDARTFHQASQLLRHESSIAERYVSARPWLEAFSHELPPALLEQLRSGTRCRATEVFEAQQRRYELAEQCEKLWHQLDALWIQIQPSPDSKGGSQPRDRAPRAEALDIGFTNLLDLCSLSMPLGHPQDPPGNGVTLVAAPGSERASVALAARLQHACGTRVGIRAIPLAIEEAASSGPTPPPPETSSQVGELEVALVGARDEPLHSQLTHLGGRFTRRARTAACYELFALAGAPPQRPALIRRSQPAGSIELDVYSLPAKHFGSLVILLSWPLCIGNIELDDGTWIHGFVCEPHALVGARDVTKYGRWPHAIADDGARVR